MIISGSLHILKKRDEDEAKIQRAMSAIETATKRGAALTGQLLTFARRQSVNPQAIRFGDRIEAIREVLHAGVGSAVRLAFDIDREVWSVKADVAELETGLLNLVINARDAMPDGGTVTVGARNVVLNDPLHSGEYVAITVADTGLGIPSDVVDKIFEPFFTTKPVGKGTGLGLSQVHGFAHQAGGTVKVTSELGKGTTFTILLPRETATAPIDIPEAVPVPGSGTVLLVEDNPDVALVSIGLLEQLGYRVHRVADAESALRELEKNGVDFVFTDIVMPGKMDGLGLAHHLRQIHPGLPILLATGYSEAAADVRGDFPILRKPYEIHELSEAISKLPR
jgi:CheY-like chemotaxis protein/anti-sigma regulatory factor (Ser/Thr protein kinase)